MSETWGPSRPVVHNVRRAGHIRPATIRLVYRDVHEENEQFRYGTEIHIFHIYNGIDFLLN